MGILIDGVNIPKTQISLVIFPNGYVEMYDENDIFIGEARALQITPQDEM